MMVPTATAIGGDGSVAGLVGRWCSCGDNLFYYLFIMTGYILHLMYYLYYLVGGKFHVTYVTLESHQGSAGVNSMARRKRLSDPYLMQ